MYAYQNSFYTQLAKLTYKQIYSHVHVQFVHVYGALEKQFALVSTFLFKCKGVKYTQQQKKRVKGLGSIRGYFGFNILGKLNTFV